jgi:hypothetical protein
MPVPNPTRDRHFPFVATALRPFGFYAPNKVLERRDYVMNLRLAHKLIAEAEHQPRGIMQFAVAKSRAKSN